MPWNDDPPPSTEKQVGYILKLMARLGWPRKPLGIAGLDGCDDWEGAEAYAYGLDISEASDLIEALKSALGEVRTAETIISARSDARGEDALALRTRTPHPFAGLRTDYGVALVDCPWKFKTWSAKGEGRSPSRHYDVMDLDAIKALPVADICARDCMLLTWATWPMIEAAFATIAAWGFTYKTLAFIWVKTSKSKGLPVMGCGNWTRANSEPCLLSTRGRPKRIHRDIREVILEPRRESGRKPDVYDRVERLVSGPYVELFARQRRPGWSSWGKEVDKYTCRETTGQGEPR